jgi:hypothetical protein
MRLLPPPALEEHRFSTEDFSITHVGRYQQLQKDANKEETTPVSSAVVDTDRVLAKFSPRGRPNREVRGELAGRQTLSPDTTLLHHPPGFANFVLADFGWLWVIDMWILRCMGPTYQ